MPSSLQQSFAKVFSPRSPRSPSETRPPRHHRTTSNRSIESTWHDAAAGRSSPSSSGTQPDSQASTDPLTPPMGRDSALHLARQGSPSARYMSDAQLLAKGSPLTHFSAAVTLQALLGHRRVLSSGGHAALALSFLQAEHARCYELLRAALDYYHCIDGWFGAFMSGTEVQFDADNAVRDERGHALSMAERLEAWATQGQHSIRELQRYDAAADAPAEAHERREQIACLDAYFSQFAQDMQAAEWNVTQLPAQSLLALAQRSRAVGAQAVELTPQPLHPPELMGTAIGLGLRFSETEGDAPPSYPEG